MQKAYKVLAIQENISNGEAKKMIDNGMVKLNKKVIKIARGEIPVDAKLTLQRVQDIRIIFQDDDIVAIDKPAFSKSEFIAKKFKNYILLNRLDADTSGVMLFAKNEEFRQKAIEEFRQKRVYKEYIAIVEGKVMQDIEVDKPILTTKGNLAISKIDKFGKPAISKVYPKYIEGNKSKIKVIIEDGRTHQIRVHLKSINLPIIGDSKYGKISPNVRRMLLHSFKTKILDYTFKALEPKEFRVFGLGAYDEI